jgi:hypothetical protein
MQLIETAKRKSHTSLAKIYFWTATTALVRVSRTILHNQDAN